MSEATTQPAPSRDVLVPWRTLPFPIDWGTAFGDGRAAGAALHLEVGFGDGRYTVRRALAAPQERFVGLEISSGSLQRGLRRVRRESAVNVRLAKTGAGFGLRHFFAPHSLTSIVVNFPDPWPKERHVSHRLLQAEFFRLAASRLMPGGSVRLATDHPGYLAFALEQAEASGVVEANVTDPPPAVFETKYALKWRAQGIPLHYVEFRYAGGATPAYPILERPAIMPHALFDGVLPNDAPFAKIVLPYADGHVVLHEVAASFGGDAGDEVRADGDEVPPDEVGAGAGPARRRWLVRATIDEPELKQQILVLVQQRTPTEVIVRLETFGDPIITPTVRGAVHGVSEWLASATGLRSKQRNY